MQLKFKQLSGESFDLVVDETETILDVKMKICSQKNFAVELQKLIYDGKVLQDDATVSSLGFDDKKFVVLMVRKPTPESKPDDEAPATKTASRSAPGGDGTASSSSTSNSAADSSGTAAPEAIGVPAARRRSSRRSRLEYLRGDPIFRHLRDIVQNNPTLLPQVIQQIAEHQPHIADDIRANQADFLAMINEQSTAEETAADNVNLVNEFLARQNVPTSNAISSADRAVIRRIVGMGFPETLVVEAYFACDKNEEHAVNYILQRMTDGDH